MKISIVGAGYVGYSLALLLSQKHTVSLNDIDKKRVALINKNKSPIKDKLTKDFLKNSKNNLSATIDKNESFKNSKYIIIAAPTDYNEKNNYFDTSIIEQVIKEILKINKDASIIIKSTVPLGFTDKMVKKYFHKKIFFSPEFLREGNALYDNLYPSRIIVGNSSKEAIKFAKLLSECSKINKKEIPILFMKNTEAEAVKLFSNTFLAMRIGYFNELDNFCINKNLSSKEIIRGVGFDKRIGDHYNNPSFGYGGYCLPKDTKQLLANYHNTPNNIINAIVQSNITRKRFIADQIINKKPKIVGIYRLIMKTNSDNFRSSAILEIIEYIKSKRIKVIIFEPNIKMKKLSNTPITNNLSKFKKDSSVILANRYHKELTSVKDKVFTRDLFGRD